VFFRNFVIYTLKNVQDAVPTGEIIYFEIRRDYLWCLCQDSEEIKETIVGLSEPRSGRVCNGNAAVISLCGNAAIVRLLYRESLPYRA
jgi:hypothetical protein